MNGGKLSGIQEWMVRLVKQRAILKALKEENDLLSADVSEAVDALYHVMGSKTFEVEECGIKLGTVSARVSKPATKLAVTDMNELGDWALDRGFTTESVDMGRVQRYFEQTGEVPPGCRVEQHNGGFAGITVRPDKDAVMESLRRDGLEDAVRGLIEGDSDVD